MVARSGYTARELRPAPTALLPDPLVLFFLLGLAARLLRSDLKVPEALYEALALYLLLAIGLKGGVELASHPLDGLGAQVAVPQPYWRSQPRELKDLFVGARIGMR